MQYHEDNLSTLDQAKDFAGSSANWYLNPLAQMRYSPSSWSVSRNAIKIRSGIFDPKNKGNKLLTWAANKLSVGFKYGQSSSYETAQFDVKTKKYIPGSAGERINVDMPKTVNRLSKGVLSYDSDTGYLGINKDFKLSETSYQKNIKAKIAGYDATVKELQDMSPSDRAHFKRLELKNKAFDRVSDSSGYNKARYDLIAGKIDDLSDDLLNGGKSKGYMRWFGKTKNIATAKFNLFMAKGGKHIHQNVLNAGLVGAKAGIMAMKVSSYVAVAQLGWSVAKMIGNPIGAAAVNTIDNGMNQLSSINSREMGGSLNFDYLSQGAATERQRAIQAISKARMNGRSMMGSEAQFMHQ